MLMQMHDPWRWSGGFDIALWNIRTGQFDLVQFQPNLITDAGLALTVDLWAGAQAVGWAYIAVGTDGTAPANGQTQLMNEVARKPVTFERRTGELLATVFFSDGEANVVIRELGLFGGDSATADPNTGVLIARAVVNINKTNLHSLTVTRRDLLARG